MSPLCNKYFENSFIFLKPNEYISDLVSCGSLKVIGPHKLLWSGTIRRCDLVGGKCVTVRVDCEASEIKLSPGFDRLLLFLPSPAPCLPARHHVPP